MTFEPPSDDRSISEIDFTDVELQPPPEDFSMGTPSRQKSTGQVLLEELLTVLEPVASAAKQGPEEMAILLERSGIDRELFSEPDFDTVTSALGASVGTIDSIRAVVDGETPKPEEVADLVVDLVTLIKSIRGLDEVEVRDPNIEAVGKKLLDFLIIDYLQREHATVYAVLVLGGVIVNREDGPDELKLERLPELLKDDGELPTTVLKWGTQEFDPAVLLYLLKVAFEQLGIPTGNKRTKPSELASLAQVEQGSAEPPDQLEVPVLNGEFGTAGLRLVPLPGDGSRDPGLALVPFGTSELELGTTIDLEDNWTFEGELTGEASASGWGLAARPTQSGLSVQFRDLEQGSNLDYNVSAESALTYSGTTDDGEQTVLLGQPDATRVSVGSVSARAALSFDGDKLDWEAGLPSSGTLAVAPGDADGFLQKVLPEDGIAYDFDAEVGYGSGRGLFFERGGTLEVSIPQEASIGPVTLKEIYLAALPPSSTAGGAGGASGSANSGDTSTSPSPGSATSTEGTITIAAAASASVTLGPVTATVRRMGVEADISFPEDRDGNYGVVDMQFGFKPPSGAGISIDAGPVSGGGYLEWDPDNERYAGVLQLKIRDKLVIDAVGLLTTELPGGEDGFSLLVIISGQFPSVPIGMGFSLEGVGGIIGVNRSLRQQPLGTAVRDGSIGSILFPQNPVANSQRIVSDLRSIFPPSEDAHVVGPMAKLSYGAGSMLLIDVGVVLSIPTWEVVLLGKVSTVLPDSESELIALNVGVAGVLDVPNERARVDGSLYDSRIYKITLTGDMALRSTWGDEPRFLMSVGGWHPQFEPPGEFPTLDPLKATLSGEDGDVSLEVGGYLAVTSNTFQFGADVLATVSLGPIEFVGRFSFDTLLEFDPFRFVTEFSSKFVGTYEGNRLLVAVDGTLTGPGPFRIRASLSVDLMGLSVNENINTTFGPSKQSEELPRAQILPKLTAELGRPVNWQAQMPADGAAAVTFRDVEPDDGEVLAHPLGEIGVRQTVVPLDTTVEKFGKARPSDYTRFTIDGVSVDGPGSVAFEADLEEEFAPAKYRKMSDAERLDSEAFVQFPAGRKMAHEGVYCGFDDGTRSKNVRETTLEYECTVIDRPRDHWSMPLGGLGLFGTDGFDSTSTLPAAVGESLMAVSAAARSPVGRADGQQFELSEVERQSLADQTRGLPSELDIAQTGSGGDGSGPTTGQIVQGGDGDGSGQVVRGGGDDGSSPATEQVVRGGPEPDVGGLSESVSLSGPEYTVATASELREVDGADGGMTRSEARQRLRQLRRESPEAAKRLRVVETGRVQSRRAATDGGADR